MKIEIELIERKKTTIDVTLPLFRIVMGDSQTIYYKIDEHYTTTVETLNSDKDYYGITKEEHESLKYVLSRFFNPRYNIYNEISEVEFEEAFEDALNFIKLMR